MNRRDLLLLRPTPRARVFELSCERLYMQYLDVQRPDGAPAADAGAGEAGDHVLGEPEARFDRRTPRDLFASLARELAAADVVTVTGRDWLADAADAALRDEVTRLLEAAVDRGVRVEVIGGLGGS